MSLKTLLRALLCGNRQMGYHPFRSLAPPKDGKLVNPIKVLRLLNQRQWAFFGVSLAAWSWDAFDFFSVSLTLTDIAKELGKTTAEISWGITLALMTRSIGAIFFGLLSDRFGRKWPFIGNVLLYSMVELATGFVTTYEQFLGVRALFGVAMGGIYGTCAATALEDSPPAARGILSGLLQQGYAMGNLLAAIFYLAIVPNTTHSWRSLMWFGAGPAILIAIWRAFLPETQTFQDAREARNRAALSLEKNDAEKLGFIAAAGPALRQNWMTLIYLVLMMTGFNFLSHGSQDLYPSLLRLQKGFDATQVTRTTAVASIGAILGGTTIGWLSSVIGRRLSIICICLVGGALVYPWAYTDGEAIMAAAFAEQFCVQGAWGVVPIHLLELAPDQYRSFVVGTSYQLGNLISSASSTIEAELGTMYPLPARNGVEQYDYAKVMAIFIGCVYVYLIAIIALGPEKRSGDDDNKKESELKRIDSASPIMEKRKTVDGESGDDETTDVENNTI